MDKQPRNIEYLITPDEAELICVHFGLVREEVQEHEVCEMVAQIIDCVVNNVPVGTVKRY